MADWLCVRPLQNGHDDWVVMSQRRILRRMGGIR